MDFYNNVGKMALGSGPRRLSENQITEDAGQVYKMYNVSPRIKMVPGFSCPFARTDKTITAIAEEIGHSYSFSKHHHKRDGKTGRCG